MTVEITAAGRSTTFQFQLAGAAGASDLICSYILSPSGNQTPLLNGHTLAFPPVSVNQTATATIVVSNRGSGSGAVQAVSASGAGFRLSGLPLLPTTVEPGRELRFTIAFVPESAGAFTGALAMTLDGTVATFPLRGEARGPAFLYELQSGNEVTVLQPAAALPIPDTEVGSSRAVRFRIVNRGDGEGRVSSISLAGPGFRLTEAPALPATIPAGQSIAMSIEFTPQESGPASAQLRIDGSGFEVKSVGIGARLTLTAQSGGLEIPIPDTGAVVFPNTAVGGSSTLQMQLINKGNAPALVSSIAVSGRIFQLTAPPALPAQLGPDQAMAFSVAFVPENQGAVTGSLQIDARSYAIRAAGTSPPALPAVIFHDAPESAEPLQQPSVGLSLEKPYFADVTGKLSLTFVPDSFVDDPAIQFATGSRVVDFRIPANTTDAIFSPGGKRIQFQAGTVAGRVALRALLNVALMDVTPGEAPSKWVAVAATPPRIRSVQIGSRSAAGFELLVTGYSSMRSVREMTFTFTPAAGKQLQTATLTANVESSFSAWYESSTSRPFGSQFTASIFFNVAGASEDLQSISVTAANAAGLSNSGTVNLQ
jgi:hypothetical protein